MRETNSIDPQLNLFTIRNTLFAVWLGEYGERMIDRVYPSKDGVVFLDIGWDYDACHTAHLIKGEVKQIGAYTWEVGFATFYLVDFDDPIHENLIEPWKNWQEYKNSPLGKRSLTEEAAIENARTVGALI